MNQTVEITLTVEQVNAVLNVLGNQPTSTGLYPLLLDIKQQAEDALKPKPQLAEVDADA